VNIQLLDVINQNNENTLKYCHKSQANERQAEEVCKLNFYASFDTCIIHTTNVISGNR